jgi:hypothetical protein
MTQNSSMTGQMAPETGTFLTSLTGLTGFRTPGG